MPTRQYNPGTYKYGYNGKENDNEAKGIGNQQDYGMRIYDNRLGKFLSVDPLTDDYPELTPYQFASNRPIDGIDLDGLEWMKFKLTKEEGKPVLKTTSVDIGYETTFGFQIYDKPIYSVDHNGSFYSFSSAEEMAAFAQGDQSDYASDAQVADQTFATGASALVQMHGEAQNDAANTALTKGGGTPDYDAPAALPNKQQASANKGVDRNGSKTAEWVKGGKVTPELAKRYEKLNKVDRSGKDFTQAGKKVVIDINSQVNGGNAKCVNCGVNTTPATQSKKGVTPSGKETNVDHVKRKREGGRGNPNNGDVLCRDCNLEKH